MSPGKHFIQPRELSFFDLDDRLQALTRQRDPLERLNRVISWDLFVPVLDEALVAPEPRGPGGRPAYPHLLLFKSLVVQRIYDLSDEQLQFQILDRLSFQRFLQLGLADPVPDQNTFREFRERLVAADAFDKLFAAFGRHLDEAGLLPKKGVMIDATFVEIPRQHNTREENAQIKAGEVPAAWDEKTLAHKDIDARWAKKDEETYYGYKDHVKVNVETKLIEAAVITAASVHDSQVVDDLIQAGDEVCIADSAYAGRPVAAVLARKAVAGMIVQPARRNRPLSEADQEDNHAIAKVRARVEHGFAVMSGQAGRIFQRYVGRARNSAGIVLLNLTYNLGRYETILRLKLHPANVA